MTVYFLDSSALVKKYISEVGSAWILNLLRPETENDFFAAAVTGVEVIAAITRRARGNSISRTDAAVACQRFRKDCQEYLQVIQITDAVITAAIALAEAQALRGYDAIQLAAGCAVNQLSIASDLPPVVFVSADDELNRAAVGQ
ncbi:MAG: type II toxin-antitoxin system VapC family toxin, partial [Cyanobacteria bacterium J06636_16]